MPFNPDGTYRETTNADRAKTSIKILELYAQLSGMTIEQEAQTILGDLLADLMHWCDYANAMSESEDVDFDQALAMAYSHYTEEVQEERDETYLKE